MGRPATSDRQSRVRLTVTILAGAILLAFWATDHAGPSRGAAWIRLGESAPARESRIGTVRHVHHAEAPARLVLDTVRPDGRVRLLWLEGRATQPLPRGAVVVNEDGQVLIVDDRLVVRWPRVRAGGRVLESAAAGPGGLWLTDVTGRLLLLDSAGQIRRERLGPYAHPTVSADSSGRHAWLTRSTRHFAFAWDSVPAPVAVAVGGCDTGHEVGTAVVPEHVLLTDLANAGHLAVDSATIYYAPFIRDEIMALRATGETLWVTHRELGQATGEPRFEVQRGRAVIDYHPVNLGLSLGPDGLLYALSTPGRTTDSSRLDVLDPRTGRLLRSARLGTALPTLAGDSEGRVYAINPDRLLRGTPPAERESFPEIDLPSLVGGRITSTSLRGRVVLVNVWASWCAPCRAEMPALDSLRQRLIDPGFMFITLNEDQRVEDARAFLRELGFQFPVALGRGTLQGKVHYPGLPYTVLLDREGAVVQRWSGFAGTAQIDQIEGLARRELARTGVVEGHGIGGHVSQHGSPHP